MTDPVREYMAQIGAKGGRARAERLSEGQLSAGAQQAAKARWEKRTQKRTLGQVAREIVQAVAADGIPRTLFRESGTFWYALPASREASQYAQAYPMRVIGTYGKGASILDIVEDACE